MIFNQFAFLFLFLPVTLFLFYFGPTRRWRVEILIAASFVFYGISGLTHTGVLAASIAWVYLLQAPATAIGNPWRLTAAILVPAGALIYFKYSGFLLGNFLTLNSGDGFSLFNNIILPAGISFFTFQLIAYAIDRYRGSVEAPPTFRQFALYVSFFPQLVAGPIVRLGQVRADLINLVRWRPRQAVVERSVALFCLGLGAKVLLADTLGAYLSHYRAPETLGTVTALYATLAYSFQIYFDFFGYSLMAIGLGGLFGITLPRNFDDPYRSYNPRDFWRRWHLTLSFWLRDYLYLPLGGNKRYIRNILIVFALCGLWHGAGWAFVVWGLYHAALVAGYHFTASFWNALPKALQWFATFALVSIGWILFQYDLAGSFQFAKALIGLGGATAQPVLWESWIVLAIAAAVCFGPKLDAIAAFRPKRPAAALSASFGFALLVLAALVFLDRSKDFIYFRF